MTTRTTQNKKLEVEKTILELNKTLTASREEITDLRSRITVRTAMRWLERWICFVSVNESKLAFKTKFYNFQQFRTASAAGGKEQKALAETLKKLNLTQDHLNYLEYLKDCCECEWKRNAYVDQDNDDDDLKKLFADLIAALAYFIPPPADPNMTWCIHDPVEIMR